MLCGWWGLKMCTTLVPCHDLCPSRSVRWMKWRVLVTYCRSLTSKGWKAKSELQWETIMSHRYWRPGNETRTFRLGLTTVPTLQLYNNNEIVELSCFLQVPWKIHLIGQGYFRNVGMTASEGVQCGTLLWNMQANTPTSVWPSWADASCASDMSCQKECTSFRTWTIHRRYDTTASFSIFLLVIFQHELNTSSVSSLVALSSGVNDCDPSMKDFKYPSARQELELWA